MPTTRCGRSSTAWERSIDAWGRLRGRSGGGAGQCGCAAALTLAATGADVVLAHRPHPRQWHVGESLAPTARPLLDRLGILDRVASHGHEPWYGTRSVWGDSTLTASDFIGGPYGPGWLLDRRAFDVSLRDAAREAGCAATTAVSPP